MHIQGTDTTAHTRPNPSLNHDRAASKVPMPAGFTRQQIRRLVAQMIG